MYMHMLCELRDRVIQQLVVGIPVAVVCMNIGAC